MRRLALALTLAATPALADSPRAQMFPSDASCYLRQYDDAHLASHPDQMVTMIALGPDQGNWEADVLVLKIAVQLRDSSELFQSYAYCDTEGALLACQLEGDGGGFHLKPHARGPFMMVGEEALGFEGADGFVTFGGGFTDDDAFILPLVPADSCP